MRTPGHTPRRLWADTSERHHAVWSAGTLDQFTCPICRGACLTRPLPRRSCPFDYEWVCNPCGAHGTVHLDGAKAAADAAEVHA